MNCLTNYHSQLSQWVEALRCYNRAITLNPAYAAALCNIGLIYKQNGQLEAAIKFYLKSLTANQNLAIAKLNLSIAYVGQCHCVCVCVCVVSCFVGHPPPYLA